MDADEQRVTLSLNAFLLRPGVTHVTAPSEASAAQLDVSPLIEGRLQFVKLPVDKRGEASLGSGVLASGWSCTVGDGITANVSCAKDGLALHTEQ